MPAIRQPDDEIRLHPPAETDDLDALSTQGMMGMSDSDKFRSWLE
jgi:hypothetical protein